MPTVTYKCGETGKTKKKTFAYNAVGKAQAGEFAKTMGGKIKNNPSYGTEKTMKAVVHFLNYAALNPDAEITYRASDMILRVESDAATRHRFWTGHH